MPQRIEEEILKLSRTKALLSVLVYLLFILCSLWIVVVRGNQLHYVPGVAYLTGMVGVITFLMFGASWFSTLFKNQDGLIINNEGVFDNTPSMVSGHLIKWGDITGFKVTEVKRAKILYIYVKNPEDYLAGKSVMQKLWLNLNMKTRGTPLAISAAGLTCSFNEMHTKITDAYNAYHN